ncbi:hypothetical protein C2845_PM12G06570 [Panicum miliaceum]|uniref:Protein kinase domain-containing protein n=1 Tax=Panicum miliaceum TaxID=4540 RepID=A0A3L6QGB9_PANMI|nr:hypothetical protein C2845_PM12G06570 [Panicum miliaceum]
MREQAYLLAAAAAAALVSSSQLLLLAAAVAAESTVGLPGCPTSCGEVTVPYPFGVGPGCYLRVFGLTCDTSHAPPRLSLGGGGDGALQVVGISLDNSTVRVHGPGMAMNNGSIAAREITVANGTWGGPAWGLVDGGPYVLSPRNNEVVLSGCNLFVELLIAGNSWWVINSCGSVCSAADDYPGPDLPAEPWWSPSPEQASHRCHNKCSGIGCCQAPIPNGIASYDVRLKALGAPWPHQITVQDNFSVLIAEEGWLVDGNASYVASKAAAAAVSKTIPAVLAWVVTSGALDGPPNSSRYGNATCPIDLGSTECHSSYSTCTSISRESSGGCICRCWDGYQGNPYLPDGCQGRLSIIGLGVGSAAIFLFTVLGTTYVTRKLKERRKKRLREIFFEQNRGQLLQQLVCHRIDIAERMIVTLEELEKATNNFDKSRELGGGGHGIVYKGFLSNLHVVAIKKSKIVIQKDIYDFINEVAILSQINHRNIVKLFGCCLETEVPLLVYELISNGTLHSHLHVEGPVSISWKDRLRIAVETARALAYLHSLVSTPVIHRDIKSPNILLDDNLTVKLSEFQDTCQLIKQV